MGSLATLFCRRGAESPAPSKKQQQHSTLDVQLPVSPTSPGTIREMGPSSGSSGSSGQERRVGPRLPREAGTSTSFRGTNTSDRPSAGQNQQAPATHTAGYASHGMDTLAQRVEMLRLREEMPIGGPLSSSPGSFPTPNPALSQSRSMGTTRLGHYDLTTTPPYQPVHQPALDGAGAPTPAPPTRSQPLVPFSHAVRAIRVSSAPAVPSLPASSVPSLPPPPPYSALDSRASSSPLLSTRPLSTAVAPPAVPPRPPPRSHTGSASVPPPPIRHSVSLPAQPLASTEAMTRQPFSPVPAPPIPPPRLLAQSCSAPVLQQQSHSKPQEVGPSDGPQDSPLRPLYSGDERPSCSPRTRTPAARPQPKMTSSKSFPSSILPAARLPLLPDENELLPPRTLGRQIDSPPTASSAPTTPIRKAARRSEPVSSSSSPSSARSTPASARRAPKSSATRQCDGITAQSKRCTRMVQLAQSAGGSSMEEGSSEPVYCKQHAKLALVETGYFLSAQREGSTSQREERWITFSDWIDADLPIETQALLRHYMMKPVSQHDQEGYIYLHELVPRGGNGGAPSHRRPAGLDATAHIKLGRTLKPVARLSQWRATCPSREPIVRFIFPRAALPAHKSSPAPRHAHFAPQGTKNHHRWERLCLVELAGRAIASPEDEQKCTDCGAKHVECFRIDRKALATNGADWSVEDVVEKWQRW